MKLLYLFLFGVCMSLHASTYSQQAKVSLDVKEASLNDVLQEVSRQTQIDILYNLNFIKGIVVKDLKVENKNFEVFLDELLPRYGLSYSFDDNVVVVKRVEKKEETKPYIIRGKVTDQRNLPLPGVTILIKGTHIGTATNSEGVFSQKYSYKIGII